MRDIWWVSSRCIWIYTCNSATLGGWARTVLSLSLLLLVGSVWPINRSLLSSKKAPNEIPKSTHQSSPVGVLKSSKKSSAEGKNFFQKAAKASGAYRHFLYCYSFTVYLRPQQIRLRDGTLRFYLIFWFLFLPPSHGVELMTLKVSIHHNW